MTLRPVLKGTPIQQRAEGTVGIVRKPAPSDGFAVDLGEECGFVSLEEVAEAAKALRKLRGGR